jgi:uncharacterized protein YndB with AHSA1/START domain
MADILHKIGIRSSSPAKVYAALTTLEGLSGWWTNDTRGESGSVGGAIVFRFSADGKEIGAFAMRVIELAPESRVLWQVADGPEDWIGTKIGFDVHQDGNYTIVLFKHQGWKETGESMHHCSTKWAMFLMSLKSLLETGKGAPSPEDVKIDNWN